MNRMWYYLKKYPLSLLVLAVIVYLSFFQPPDLEVVRFPGIDKVVHICMYAGLSGILWFEFFRNHRRKMVVRHAWIGAVVCPILLSGLIELLQEYGTIHRGGDWFDFLANNVGVGLGTLFAWWVLRPRLVN